MAFAIFMHTSLTRTWQYPQSMVDCLQISPVRSSPEMTGNCQLTLVSSINYWIVEKYSSSSDPQEG